MLAGLGRLGVDVAKSKGRWIIWGRGGDFLTPKKALDAKNSATSLTFLTAISSLSELAVITGDASLRARCFPQVVKDFRKIGIKVSPAQGDSPPFVVMGSSVKGGRIRVSSQPKFFPAFIIPGFFANKSLELVTDFTVEKLRHLQVLRKAGAPVKFRKKEIRVDPEVPPKFRLRVPADADLLAPLITLAVLTDSKLWIKDGEGEYVKLLRKFGIRCEKMRHGFKVEGPQSPRCCKMDLEPYPQFFPFLCVLASQARGTSIIGGLHSAKTAKIDRVECMIHSLRKMGAKIREKGNVLVIEGPTGLIGQEIDARGDPCTAAALIVAGSLASGRTIINNATYSLRLTYPSLLGTLTKMGGEVGLVSW